jgi:hypothetical protein
LDKALIAHQNGHNMTSRGGQYQRGGSAGTLRDLVRVGLAAGAAGVVVAVLVAPVTTNVGVLVADTTRQNTVVTAAVEAAVHPRDIKVRLRPTPLGSTPDATDSSGLVALELFEGDISPPPSADQGAEASLLTVDPRLRPLPAPSAFHPAEQLGLPPAPPTPTIPAIAVEDPAVPPVVITTIPKKGSPPALTTTSAPRKTKPMKPGKPPKPGKPAKADNGHDEGDKAKPGVRGAPRSANGDAHRRDGDDDRGRAAPGHHRGSGQADESRDEKKNPKAGGPGGGPGEKRADKATTPESSGPGNSDKPAKAKKDKAHPSDQYASDESEPTG